MTSPLDEPAVAEVAEAPREGAGRPRPWAIALGPVLFALAFVVPLPTLASGARDLVPTTEVRAALGLVAWMSAWWMTEAVDLAVTSLLPLVVLPLSRVTPMRSVAPSYFDETVVLFLGGFCLALALERTGLHVRIAHRVVRLAGTRPRRLVLGFFGASALVSMWISNTATALTLMPVAMTVVAATTPAPGTGDAKGHRTFAAAMGLAVAYGASLGGVGTLVGTPPNLIFQRFVTQDPDLVARGHAVSFGRWLLVGVPLVLVLVPLAALLLTRVSLRVPRSLGAEAERDLAARLAPRGRMTVAQRATAIVFGCVAVLWMTREPMDLGALRVPLTGWGRLFGSFSGGAGRPEPFVRDSTVAMVGALALLLLPSGAGGGDRVLPWDYAVKRLPWGVLLLFGGGFALAEAFGPSGLNAYLAAAFQGLKGLPPLAVLAAVAFGMTALSEVASNTAAITMMLPVLKALAEGLHTDPLPILLVGTLAASCGFMLPVATPANAIAYATGRVPVRAMGRAGFLLDVVATLVMIAAVWWLGPLAFG